jgi:hypothetical protein
MRKNKIEKLTDEQMAAERERLEHPTNNGTTGWDQAREWEPADVPVEKTELACLRSIDASLISVNNRLGTINAIAIWFLVLSILGVVVGLIATSNH